MANVTKRDSTIMFKATLFPANRNNSHAYVSYEALWFIASYRGLCRTVVAIYA